MAMRGFKILTPIAFVGLVFVTGVYKWNPYMMIPVAAAVGYLFPEMFLAWRVNARQHRLRRGLPDGLDLAGDLRGVRFGSGSGTDEGGPRNCASLITS